LLPLVGSEQFAEQLGKRALLLFVERRQQGGLVCEMQGRYSVHKGRSFGGELDQHSAGVVWIGDALDEVGALEAVEPVGDCPGRPHQRDVELRGREAVCGLVATEAGEHVPGCTVQPEFGELGVDARVDVCGRPA
jgi:hypothetical protein